uniref:Glycerol-3-phosphate acyltransferase n=1 Tax=mine drainage metagenome TaxID=410659 RepID=E6QI51_9ZZZZ
MPVHLDYWLHSLRLIAVAYFLGSIPTGYLLIRIFRNQDIRTLGSGNIGATNVLRSGAKGLGAVTFLLDVLKGAAAVILCGKLATIGFPIAQLHGEALGAFCAVLGHMFPIWLNLKGGKGVATAFGVFVVLAPEAGLLSLAVFILLFAVFRYVSLASILGAASFPVWARLTTRASHDLFIFAVEILIPLFIIAKHGQNISRLLAGTEYRFGKQKTQPTDNAA